MLEVLFVGQPHRDRILDIARRGSSSSRCQAQIADEVGLAAVEYELNGVDRHNGGEQRRTGGPSDDQVAGVHASVRDSPGYGRTYRRPFEIELRLPERGFGRADAAGGVALDRFSRVELAIGYGLVAGERRCAVDVVGGDFELRLRAFDVSLRLIDRNLVRARVDDEEEVPFLDDLSILEMDRTR